MHRWVVFFLLLGLLACNRPKDLSKKPKPMSPKSEISEPIDYANEEQTSTQSKPNIIFILADDMGTVGASCYGNDKIQTPNIDKMAKEGIMFNQAYSGSTVCAPARCVLMTGKHIGHCSVRVNCGGVPLLKDELTVAEVLQKAGYKTGGFGKWALGVENSSGDPNKKGFDEYYGYYHQTHAHDHFPEYLVRNGQRVKLEGNIGANMHREKIGFVSMKNEKTGMDLTYAPYEIFDEAKQFISNNKDAPFFCYLPVTPPHSRFQVPDSDPVAKQLENENWSDQAKAVVGMTLVLDRQVGELYELLEELQIADNTLVIFCSDHGAEHRFDQEVKASGNFKGKKRSMYEGGLRVPFIAHWPDKIQPESVSNHPIYFGDVFQTLADIAGAKVPKSARLDSVSFLPTLLGKPEEQLTSKYFLWQFAPYNANNDRWGTEMKAIRRGQWKLLKHGDDEWELYDLSQDPFERVNLAPKRKERVENLIALYERNFSPCPPQKEALKNWRGEFPFNGKIEYLHE